MRHVEFDRAQLSEEALKRWDDLQQKARDATEAMFERHRAREDPNPDAGAAIWAEIKRFLLDEVFHRKCAYCEAVTDAHAPQHAEHWRPKNAVTDPTHEGGPKKVVNEGGPHPGYWWLALAWENLVPACHYCNAGKGKGTKFPVARDYVFEPERDIDALDAEEEPLLLHPFRGDLPEHHIGFLEDGYAFARPDSKLGCWTLKVLDLNRQPLVDERVKHLQWAGAALLDAARDAYEGRPPRTTLNQLTAPSAVFSRTVCDVVVPKWAQVQGVGG